MDTKGHCFPKSIIIQVVYFKLRFTLSYRKIVGNFKNKKILNALLLMHSGFILEVGSGV
jgi:transposase-like protein